MDASKYPPIFTRAELRDQAFYAKNRDLIMAARLDGRIVENDRARDARLIEMHRQYNPNIAAYIDAAPELFTAEARAQFGVVDQGAVTPPPEPDPAVSDRQVFHRSDLRDPAYFEANRAAIHEAARTGRIEG